MISAARSEPPEFLSVAGEDLDQIPLGPVHGDIEPASHLHLTGAGDTIVRLETRLGYTHKGTLTLMRGQVATRRRALCGAPVR